MGFSNNYRISINLSPTLNSVKSSKISKQAQNWQTGGYN